MTHPALADLAELGPRRTGAKQWAPPDELIDAVINARRNQASYNAIAETLRAHGVSASFGGVRRWLQDRGL